MVPLPSVTAPTVSEYPPRFRTALLMERAPLVTSTLAAPALNVPAFRNVPPEKVLRPVSVVVPEPFCTSDPFPVRFAARAAAPLLVRVNEVVPFSVPLPLTVPLPSESEVIVSAPVRASVPPLMETTGKLVSSPVSVSVPLVIVRAEAPALPLNAELPPTVIVPAPRFALTAPPLSW